jgi:hypothetical protein
MNTFEMKLVFPARWQIIVVYFAANHAKRGGIVYLQNYSSMPHDFLMFESHPSAKACYRETVEFVNKVTTGQILDTHMTLITGRGRVKSNLDLKEYPIYYSKEEVFQYLHAMIINSSLRREWRMLSLRNKLSTSNRIYRFIVGFKL